MRIKNKNTNLTFAFIATIFIAVLLFISGCANANQQQLNESPKSLEFKQMCEQAGYEWMLMKPTQDGRIIRDAQECWGCMVEHIEHVCSMKKFEELMKTGVGDGMDSMQHMAMTAHAGNKNSVDIHMYKVSFVRPDLQPGKEALLKFTIDDLNSKKPVTDLEIVHDKIIHVVLVRNDLKHFDHIHPEMKEPGIFTVTYNFPASGLYRTWIDFTIDGMQHIVDFDINILGNKDVGEKDMLEGVKVNFESPKEISAGNEAELKFEVFDDNNKPITITKKFLGASAHLIEIDQTLEEFGHNHDESFDNDNTISFKHTFSKAGRHKLWVQFLADDKIRTASFEIMVI